MAKRGSRALRFGLITLVISILCIIVGLTALLSLAGSLSSVAGATVQPVPGVFVEELDPGDYVVAIDQSTGVAVGTVVIVDPAGNVVPLRDASAQTFTRSGQEFAGESLFTASAAGPYTIAIEATGTGEAIVADAIDLGGGAAIRALLLLFGIALFLISLVLIIVGLIRRRGRSDDGSGDGGWTPPAPPSAYGQPNPVQPAPIQPDFGNRPPDPPGAYR
ncbi:MAG: hypothetical protein AAGA59_03000 [Actinomycetota bacterium]